MSIIQEALKKASDVKSQDNPAAAAALKPVSGEKKRPKKQNAGSMIFAILVIAALIAILNHLIASRRDALAVIASPLPYHRDVGRDSFKHAGDSRRQSYGSGNFILSGVMRLLDGPRAIINGVVVGVGDTVGGGKVRKISEKHVVIDLNDRQTILNIED